MSARSRLLLLMLSTWAFLFLGAGAIVLATQPSDSWISGAPHVAEHVSYAVTPIVPAPAFSDGNKGECYNQRFDWRPQKKNIAGVVVQQKASFDVCAFSVTGGTAATYSPGPQLKLNSAALSGTVSGPAGSLGAVRLVPNSSNAVEFVSGYMRLLPNGLKSLEITKNTDGSIKYKISVPTDLVKNGKGNYITPQTQTMSFSDNGEWAVLDAPGTGLVRINMNTSQVLVFANGFGYSGNNPQTQTAISNDGKYAVVAARLANTFKIYRLDTCTAPKNNGLVSACEVRDLQLIMQAAKTGYAGGASAIKFVTNTTLQFYAYYNFAAYNNATIGQFTMSATGQLNRTDYLALGDSFASGEGAYSYRSGTDTQQNKCHQSGDAYFYKLDQQLSLGASRFVACSGAKIWDILEIINEKYSDYPQAKDKKDEMFNSEIYSNFLPGYRAQLNFVYQNKPNYTTISIGGNNIGFGAILKACVSEATTCYATRESRIELVRMINRQYPELLSTYQKLKSASASDTKTYVVAYPQVAKHGGNCANNVHLNEKEILFASQLITYLNDVIEMAATNAGVAYVDAESAFAGHRMCETKSSNIAVNGLTASAASDMGEHGPIASESYHPNRLGHELLAQAIADKTNSFTTPNPNASNAGPVFADENTLELITTAPATNVQTWDTFYNENIAPDVVVKNQTSQLIASQEDQNLKANAQYEAFLYSTPTPLGTINTDGAGNINAALTIPESVEPGYHTLHIRGQNILNEPIDIIKIVYVADTVDDLDGDGTLNISEICTINEPAGADVDKDGADDACDPLINEAPPEPAPEPEPTPQPLPDPVQDPAPIPEIDPEDPPIVVVKPPIEAPIVEPLTPKEVTLEESGKFVPDGESNLTWILALNAQIQNELAVRAQQSTVAPVVVASSPASTSQATINTSSAAAPVAPVTSVAGVKTNSQPLGAQGMATVVAKKTPELAVLLVAGGLLGFGVIALLWRLKKSPY